MSRAPGVGALVVAMAFAGCGGPTEEMVREGFERENPAFTVVSAQVGEGDSQHAYMHIRYRRRGSETYCNAVWGYRREDSHWVVFHKGRPEPFVTECAVGRENPASEQRAVEQEHEPDEAPKEDGQ